MNPIWSVFRKDGVELLRDRRTLFVNVVLPVLLYPVMLMFLIQVYQLTQANRPPPPQVALIDVDPGLLAQLTKVTSTAGDDPTAAPGDADRPPTEPVAPLTLVTVEDGPAKAQARALATDLSSSDTATAEARAALLRLLRQEWSASAIIIDLGPAVDQRRLLIANDNADAQYDRADQAIHAAVQRWRRNLIEERLAAADLPTSTLQPIQTEVVTLAPAAQATRMRLAGIIPLLLVIMAISGAFYPALDLIAGERERGTLETLLTWPVRRRDLFLGKLLVTVSAALVAVVLNLLSLGVTVALAGSQLAGGGGGGDVGGLLSVGAGTLALSFLALLPLVVTLSAVSLALAGFAASSKEAQNYLSPLFLVVVMAAAVAQVPDARPTLALDLIPITGPVLALKEALRANEIPWLHLLVSTGGSLVVAAVVVAWSVRLLDQESFCYPGLVRAGWGRWRRWGAQPLAPGGLEALGVFAVCAAAFLLIGPQLTPFGPVAQIAGPLIVCLALPVLIHAWAGRYPPHGIHLATAPARELARGLLAVPCALALSLALSTLQPAPPPGDAQSAELTRIMESVLSLGGLPLLILVLAVTPGICEELLCRGTLLAGLRRSLGTTGAVLVSSFCFAALHLSPYRFLPQFTLGIFLALLTLRSGSLWPAVIVHIGHNALAVSLAGDGDEAPLSDATAALIGLIATVGLIVLTRPRRQPAVASQAPERTYPTP